MIEIRKTKIAIAVRIKSTWMGFKKKPMFPFLLRMIRASISFMASIGKLSTIRKLLQEINVLQEIGVLVGISVAIGNAWSFVGNCRSAQR